MSSLNPILKDKELEYGNNRGLGAGVSAAWRYCKEKDSVVYHAIVFTYTD